MLEKTTVFSNQNSVLSGYADRDKISGKKVAALSGTWKHPAGQLLKNGSSTVAYLDGDVFVKCNPARTLPDSLRKNFRKSRAENNRIMAEELASIGISTPKVLCAVRERRGVFVICDYLVTEILEPENTLYLHRINQLDPQERLDAFSGIVKMLKTLHLNNICHGDASLRNFYLNKSSGTIGTIDLDGCKKIFAPLKKRVFVREAARVISSWMIHSNKESSEEYEYLSKLFVSIYGKNKLPEKLLKSKTEEFLRKTRRK